MDDQHPQWQSSILSRKQEQDLLYTVDIHVHFWLRDAVRSILRYDDILSMQATLTNT